MPKHKIKRQEEVPTENWIKIIQLAQQLDFSNARIKPPYQLWFAAVIAIDWLTGKRIDEILQLKRKDITFTDKLICIRFHVGKKKNKKAPIERQPYQKNRNILHKAVPYIQAYLTEFDAQTIDKEEQLFPTKNSEYIRTVKTKFINGQGIEETRTYRYIMPGGYVREENARFWLTKINEQLPLAQRIYFHYGRHSIGIKLAYQGKSNIEIARVLDESPRAALAYTIHAGALGEECVNETE